MILLEEYLRHRPNDLSAISDMIAAYAGIGDWKGVGKMLDRSAELEVARDITPLTTAYYFPYDRGRAKHWADRLASANLGNFEKTFAVDLYLAAGESEAAYAVMDASDVDDVSRYRRRTRPSDTLPDLPLVRLHSIPETRGGSETAGLR